MDGTQRVACSEGARRLDRRETARCVASRDATTCATSFDAVCHRQCMQTGRRIHGCTLLLFQCSALQCPINARARGARPYVTSSPSTRYGTLTARPRARAGGWGALTRLVRINVRIDHTMRDGNARSGPAANTRRTEESLMHESAIYASPDPPWLWGRCSRGAVESASANDVAGPGQAVCVPCVTLLSPIADGAIADARGVWGPGPGGAVSRACSRVAATRVRWASGCACAAYPGGVL